VRGAWRRWARSLDERESGTSLALFRIGVGLCVAVAVAAVALAGVVPALWLPIKYGGYQAPAEPWLFHRLGGVTPATVWSTVAVTVACGLCLAAGLGGRLPALVALFTYQGLTSLNGGAVGSYDVVAPNALWLLVLARSTATLSLDCRLRTGRWTSEEPVPAWPRWLAAFQLVLIYWSTGAHKLSAAWVPGGDASALYYTLQQPSWQRRDMSWLAWAYPLTQAATLFVWLWEVSSPLLLLALWYRRTADRPGRLRALFNRINFRRWFVLAGVAMHLGVLALMEVGPFSLLMLAFYPCLYRPGEWRRATSGGAVAAG
jgi:hypothetical protein